MAKPNPDAPIRVLVCDPDNQILPALPKIFHKRFGEGDNPREIEVREIKGLDTEFRVGKVEFHTVSNMGSVPLSIRSHGHARGNLYYSLVLYEAEQVKKSGSARVIAKVRQYGFFLPQMIVGKGLPTVLAGQCARAGALYFAEHTNELEDQISKIYQRPRIIPNLTLVKIGGSALDYDRQIKNSRNLDNVCQYIMEIHQDRHPNPRKRKTAVNRMIVTVGAGQYGDIVKDHASKYWGLDLDGDYPKAMGEALKANLENIKTHFRFHGEDLGTLINTGAFYYITQDRTSKKIPLINTAPHYITVRDKIPLQDSDTHTIALAEFYGAERIILIKRTDGIYNFDPYGGFTLDPKTNECADIDKWRKAQEGNRRHNIVTIDEMLSGSFSREGTGIDGKQDGSKGHLMEDSALEYFAECQNVKEIIVTHIAPEEMYYQVDKKVPQLARPVDSVKYKHIVTGEELTLEGDQRVEWNQVLEQRIKDAFQGKAYSKIVKTKEIN